ncbi:MAG: succinyldiaminopimelate transaminase [Methylophilaceae bacterium]|jgi:N-succinyldiaminopimelate aminotransferase|nr:succinyldiaminopimelate transaminase [Methylophilaceae bacterium]
MNPRLQQLQPYPFQRLRALFAGVTANPDFSPINLSIGEPKHATPSIIQDALKQHLDGLASYPTTQGSEALRTAIQQWLVRRYAIPALNIDQEILPVNGSREALFAFAQAVINQDDTDTPIVISPNPFYQIYEGAALLAGAQPYYLNTTPASDHLMDLDSVPEAIWQRTQLIYVCTPGNPSGKVMPLSQWQQLFSLSDRYDFVIAADECYSEIYFDEQQPPLGALQAAHQLGRDWRNLVMFSSLSKRSNVPGMRSGFVAGDAAVLQKFLQYRTYHGCAMSPSIQSASIAAWNDETHVQLNRDLYRTKFAQVTPILQQVLDVEMPDAAFYLWAKSDIADTELALRFYRDLNVTVLPGSFLARDAHASNPGAGFIRMALVASVDECLEAAHRIQRYLSR